MGLDPEYIKFLQDEVKAFDKEIHALQELPNVKSLRDRVKKDKRDTKVMLALYGDMIACDAHIRAVKDEIRACNDKAMKLLGHRLQRVKRKYDRGRDTSYDFL